MAKKKPFPFALIAMVIILVLGAVAFFIFQDDIFTFAGSLEERFAQVPFFETEIVEETMDDPEEILSIIEIPPTPEPEGFAISDETLVQIFLESLGLTQIETFNVVADIKLVDANLEEQLSSSLVKIQPLDPRQVIVEGGAEIDPSRLFISTDFSSQLNDEGTRHHKFSGWDIVNDFGRGASIPVAIITTANCRVPDTGVCVQVIGSKNNDDDTANGSVFHGITKEISISDWTREGDLTLEFDYDCNQNFVRRAEFKAVITGDRSEIRLLPCLAGQHFEQAISLNTIGDNNALRVSLGARALNVDKFRMDIQFNNVMLEGNSVAKREAIGIIQSLSIVENTLDATPLDLGFIETKLVGKTFSNSERVTVTGNLEPRIDDKTITVLDVTATGTSVNKDIALKIEGDETFVFKLDEQFFSEGTFHTFKIILDDFIVNVGTGEEQRTFEYHTPFVAYSLDFRVFENEITAFNQENRAISYPVSDSTFQICGITKSATVEEILPPEIDVIHNGFTIAKTNPRAGIVGQLGENVEFCSIVNDIPRDTTITFKVKDNFYDVTTPITQNNYFLKCDRSGCNSNIGFSEVFP